MLSCDLAQVKRIFSFVEEIRRAFAARWPRRLPTCREFERLDGDLGETLRGEEVGRLQVLAEAILALSKFGKFVKALFEGSLRDKAQLPVQRVDLL